MATTRAARAGTLATAAEIRELYDAWAPTYDDDLAGPAGDDYPLPGIVGDVVARLADPTSDVLDAACGTGLVGTALADHGFRSVDGLDLSPRMLDRARRLGVYQDLGPADLSQRLPRAGDELDVVTCVNGFEPGHLPRSALAEFARVVRRGGHVVLTVGTQRRAEIERYTQQLARRRVVRVSESSEAPLHPSTGENHLVVVLEIVASSQARGPR